MKKYTSSIIKIGIASFFVIAVILPLVQVFVHMDRTSIVRTVMSPQFTTALKNSILISVLSTVITLVLGYTMAWCMMKTRMRLKGVFSVIAVLPMLIPSISHGMGLIILFGSNGVLTNLLHLNWSIYGFWGIIVGSVLYSFPVAFLMLYDVMKYEDSVPYEAAEVLGIPKFNQFLAITLPYLRKPLVSVTFAVFTLIITDYGVPLMVGGKFMTLPVMMYQEVIGLLDFGKGSVIGAVLLLPAVLAFLIDIQHKESGNSIYMIKPLVPPKSKVRNFAASLFCLMTSLVVLIPVCSFLLLTFTKKYPIDMTFTWDNILQTFQMNGFKYLINSVMIGIVVSVVGVALAFVTAYLTTRMNGRFSKFLHLISITSLAVPGVVLGLSYVLAFQKSWIYGTLAILVLVNLVHFFASPYLMIYNSLGKINQNLEAVGMTLGISRFHMIKDVFIPQTKDTLIEMFSYYFVNSMMTISAVSFLANVNNKPIALMVPQFEAQMLMEYAAFVSLLILGINLCMKGLIHCVKKRMSIEGERYYADEETI